LVRSTLDMYCISLTSTDNLSQEVNKQLTTQSMVFEHGIEDIGALKRELGKHQQGMFFSLSTGKAYANTSQPTWLSRKHCARLVLSLRLSLWVI
jgi:hypothetical protein